MTLGGGELDAFVTKLNATGSALVYSTYLGGNGNDAGFGIALDSSGNAYVDWGSRGSGTTIGRAKLNGTDVNQDFIKGTEGGFGIAVTGGNP